MIFLGISFDVVTFGALIFVIICCICWFNFGNFLITLTEEHPGRFSIVFHHGGSIFEINKQKKYVEGRLTYFDFCNINQFELLYLSSMVLKLKYDRKTICEFYIVIQSIVMGVWTLT